MPWRAQAGDADQQAGERGRSNADGLEEALQSAVVEGRQGDIAEMLRQEPEIDRARQTKPDDDDSHGLKTGLVQRKEASQHGGERVDGVVIHLNDPSWWLNRSNYPSSARSQISVVW